MSKAYYNQYTLNEIYEKNVKYGQIIDQLTPTQTIEERQSKNDDELLSNTWTAAYHTASYYYDNPNIEERSKMRKNFIFNFHNLLGQTSTPGEYPDVSSRRNLLGWVCKKHNDFLNLKEKNIKVDCDVEKLLGRYGPNYEALEKTLRGHNYIV